MRDGSAPRPGHRQHQARSGSRLHIMSSQQQYRQQQQQQRKPPEPLRRAVADCLSASHHASLPPLTSEPIRTLQDYLANPSTIHFAYTVLLEHALAERDRSPPVVIKCVALLKRYLFRYVPPITTLQQIDSFCAALIAECDVAAGRSSTQVSPTATTSVFASEPLIKSLVYLRAVVARHLPGFSLQQSHSTLFKFQPVPAGASALQRVFTDDKEFATPAPALIDGLASIDDNNGEYIAFDLLKWRWIARKGEQIWMPSPVMTDSGGIARPQVENVENLEQGLVTVYTKRDKSEESPALQLLHASTAAAIADAAAIKSHLRDVAASKRQPVSGRGGEHANTVRKRPRPLFQYRYYSKQQPLRLSDADIEEVIAAVCAEASSPASALVTTLPGSQSGETSNVACSVLIKLMIDMYLADSRTAAPLTLTILEAMLSEELVPVRIRAFDLVLNLGVHAHLLEPDDFPTGDGIKDGHGTPRAVGEFESWLLAIVCEMMLFLIQCEEREEVVWAAAMSTLLYLVCDRGRIRRDRLEKLDIRVLRTLLDISRENAWAEEIHCRLVHMLTNLLYILPLGDDLQGGGAAAILDLEKLELIGGIEKICKEYALASTPEARRNLFTIMFEYLVCEHRSKADTWGKKFPGQDEVQAVATALFLSGAPESLSIAFRQKLSGLGGRLFKSIMKALDRDVANGRLNAVVMEEVTKSIDMLIEKHASLEGEFNSMVSVILAEDSSSRVSYLETRAWAVLHALLHSSRPDYRQHGYSWLNHLLAGEIECLHKKEDLPHRHCLFRILDQGKVEPPDDGTTSAVHLLFGLLRSRRPFVRQGFLTVLERLLFQFQRLGCAEGDVKDLASTLVSLMSCSLWQFISTNDTNRVNVLQMCNLMLSQICVRWLAPGNRRDGDNRKTSADNVGSTLVVSSIAALFLKEEAAAPQDVLTRMPTALFYWPLMQLAGATMDDMTLGIAVGSKGGGNVPGCASDVRAALLLLLVGKCTVQQAALEEVGGDEFFRSLLDDTDARIAYYTAAFLIKRMMVEDADNYQRVLHNLVFKAQQRNDEKLLENPYLQIGGILQLGPDLKSQSSIQEDG